MYARATALVCATQFGLLFGQSELVAPPRQAVVVYLKAENRLSADVRAEMEAESTRIFRPLRIDVEFRDLPTGSVQSDSAQLVILRMFGHCGAEAPLGSLRGMLSLASTPVSEGRVQPFSQVQCDRVGQLLSRDLSPYSTPMREKMMGRALGRIVAHELYHVLANETEHAEEGVAKACFSAQDLLAPEFRFSVQAGYRMRQDLIHLAAAVTLAVRP